jgi:predicted dienelactone hydrolase
MTARLTLAALLFMSAPVLAQQAKEPAAPVADGAAKEVFAVSRGVYEVFETDLTLSDKKREKNLEIRVRLPKLGKEMVAPPDGFPLVVFSHGAGGSRDAFPGLQDLLASHGYICIAPTHSDSIRQKLQNGGDVPDVRDAEGRKKLRNSVNLAERVADCVLVLDELPKLDQTFSAAMGRKCIDRERVAVAGHSAGAFTAQLCAGVKIRGIAVGKTGQGMVSIGDERFKAAVVISGQGTASPVLSESSWDAVTVPMLVFSGSLDDSPPNMGNETAATRRHPFEKSRGTAKGGPAAYLVYIEGATHGAYQGTIGAGERLQKAAGEAVKATPAEQVGNATNAAVLTFLDAHLRKDAKALATLQSDAMARTIPGKVEYQHK